MQERDGDRESMKPYIFKAEPTLIARIDRQVERHPEYEGSRARLIRKLLRDFLADVEQSPEAA